MFKVECHNWFMVWTRLQYKCNRTPHRRTQVWLWLHVRLINALTFYDDMYCTVTVSECRRCHDCIYVYICVYMCLYVYIYVCVSSMVLPIFHPFKWFHLLTFHITCHCLCSNTFRFNTVEGRCCYGSVYVSVVNGVTWLSPAQVPPPWCRPLITFFLVIAKLHLPEADCLIFTGCSSASRLSSTT